MTYEKDTRNAYRNKTKANAYKNQYTQGSKWARFTMWRQKRIIKDLLYSCSLRNGDKVLDIPCGAGYIGSVLSEDQALIVASDISLEMMELAKNEYNKNRFCGFVQADITKSPFSADYFTCVIVLALMHRLNETIRAEVLSEVVRMAKKYVIISYSVENSFQSVKKWLLLKVKPSYIPAPKSIPLNVMVEEMNSAGLKIIQQRSIVHFFSAKIVFLAAKAKVNSNG